METLLGVCSAEHAQDKIPPRIPVSLLCGKKKKKKSLDVSGGFGGGWDRMVELLVFPLQPLSR